MEDAIKSILNQKKKRYIYFQSLYTAKCFEKCAKEYGINFINEGVCSIVALYQDNTAEYISYGRHYGAGEKTVFKTEMHFTKMKSFSAKENKCNLLCLEKVL